MLWLIISTLVITWIVSGAFAATYLGRKFDNACGRSKHDYCDHDMYSLAAGALWPIAIPACAVGLGVWSLVHFGAQLGRTPSQRRSNVEQRRRKIHDFRQAQVDAANDELDRELYGEQTCSYCRCDVVRRKGQWVAMNGGSNGCYNHPGSYGGPHKVPDAIDAKIEQAERERDAS